MGHQGFSEVEKEEKGPGDAAGPCLVVPDLFSGKGEPQSSGEDEVVVFRAGGWIGDVDVANGRLPAQEGFDLGAEASVERGSILAGVGQVGKDVGLLGEDAVGSQLLRELLAKVERGETIGFSRGEYVRWRWRGVGRIERAVVFMRPNEAAEDIELLFGPGDRMPAEAAAEDRAQIEELKRVGGEVRGAEGEELRI